jgi:hypothetical protein
MRLKTILNESTTDGSLESFVYTMRLGMQGGVFTNEMFPIMKKNFLGGVLGSLKGEMSKLPADKKGEFSRYVSQLLKPLESSSNIEQFINRLGLVADTKNNILSNLGVNEMVMEFHTKNSVDWLKATVKSTLKKGKEWWSENKQSILKVIIEILAQIIVEILFAILGALLKTKVKAPKVKFGGGKFGGGGAGGNW